MALKLRPLSFALGAEVCRIDVSRNLSEHDALADFDETQLRHLERTTVLGTPSGCVYEGPLQ